jgi:hypothetical protein
MKKIAVLLLSGFVCAFAYSQNYRIDSVFLKNDSLIICKILRHKPDKFVKVQVGYGDSDIFRIKMKDVNRLVKDSALLAKEEKIRLRNEKHSQRSASNCYFKGIIERNDYIGESYFKKGGYYNFSCSLHHDDRYFNGKGMAGYMGTNLILGCQLYKKLFIGGGIGFNINAGEDMISGAGYPLFLDLRYYFTKKNIQPFINLSSGIILNDEYLQKHIYPEVNYPYHSFINPSAGIKVALGKNHDIDISLGSSLLFTKKNIYMFYYDHDANKETGTMETVQCKIMGLIVKIGFTF